MKKTRKNIMKNEEMVKITDQELRNSFIGSKIVLQNHQNPMKYSEIFHNYMEPAINEALDDEQLLKKILDWGQLIWNKAVADDFPNHTISKDIKTLFPLFQSTFHDQAFISKFLNRKKKIFGGESFYIVKQTSLLDTNGKLSVSVAVLPIEK